MLSELLAIGVGGTLLVVSLIWLVCRFALKSPTATNALWRVALLALWLLPGAVLLRNVLPVEPITVFVPSLPRLPRMRRMYPWKIPARWRQRHPWLRPDRKPIR
ncbi:MAG TPA: hypothetical protein QGH10_23660 [Armatimonadota bacterium]|jgi:hypothetical protein|nr:hypothetical protein [Armatimonadota bacterium]